MKKIIFAMMLALIGLASCDFNHTEVNQESFVVASVHKLYPNQITVYNKHYEVELATSQDANEVPITLCTDYPYRVGDIVELKKK